jgi:spore coat protein U-like protein
MNRLISGVIMRKILTATLAAGALAAGVAQSATTTNTLTVNATVLSSCSVAVATLTFPAYTPLGGAQTASTNLLVKCTNGSPFTVLLDKGANGTIGQRLMASGGNTLQYNLYTTNAYNTIFGDGTAGSKTVTGTGVGLSTAVQVPVYGQLPDSATNQLAIPANNYQDTVNITVNY